MTKTKRTLAFQPSIFGTTTLGTRGQLVIPAEARRALKLKPGDKLVVFAGGGPLCLVKADAMRGFIGHLTRQLGRVAS
jgi:AbrB family looped-hinge helix DNA binding protein